MTARCLMKWIRQWAQLLINTGAVLAVVRQIPNQPLYFADEPGRARKEDAILAYSLDKALDTGDPEPGRCIWQ